MELSQATSIPHATHHTATLLPNGKALVAGGSNNTGTLEQRGTVRPGQRDVDATGTLTPHAINTRRRCCLIGKVLVAGGQFVGLLNSAELYDVGLGFDPSWQPLLTTVSPSVLPSGSALTASGSRFKGISEASGGNGSQNSSSNYPLVQLLSLANEQTLFLPVDATQAGLTPLSLPRRSL